ncbi:Hypothetical protein ORPV_420 [Orpheovirus IHUMI-LCC2]|uniref:Uncharacterized protein n=1 Tax=Orpheovirus IHUMI-LCC2 TaxID=2023057 RepID=A0A2I2L470_9VIRU|nr:Hypothetical protein ORPV_420 [Orpheovirus IHUMI-LCC2]SNW62324.1 Hypothetical protein ORPV_420 [Orpheovirus IHUMI-LCC2]
MQYELLTSQGRHLLTIDESQYNKLLSNFPNIKTYTDASDVFVPCFANDDVSIMTASLVKIIWKLPFDLYTLQLIIKWGGNVKWCDTYNNGHQGYNLVKEYVKYVYEMMNVYKEGNNVVDMKMMKTLEGPMNDYLNAEYLPFKIKLYIQQLLWEAKVVQNPLITDNENPVSKVSNYFRELCGVKKEYTKEGRSENGNKIERFHGSDVVFRPLGDKMGHIIRMNGGGNFGRAKFKGILYDRLYFINVDNKEEYKSVPIGELHKAKDMTLCELLKDFLPFNVTCHYENGGLRFNKDLGDSVLDQYW